MFDARNHCATAARSLSDRRWLRRLCQFYKIQNDLTPSYLKEPIPQPRMFLYGQRRENVLHGIDLFTDSDAIFEKSIPQCIMGYPGYMCIRREVNKL